MESYRKGASSLPPQQGSSVLRAGVRLLAPDRLPPYDETPELMTPEEAFSNVGSILHFAFEPYGKAFKHISQTFARKSGKVQTLESAMKDLQAQVSAYGFDSNEAARASERLSEVLAKTHKKYPPKGKRIPQHEPYYVKLTKKKRR